MLDIDRFGLFVTSITQIYRHMQKIKQLEMTEFGLRGSHVMCVYNLSRHKNGLTPTELCTLCEEDKGAVSRTLSELKKLGYINYTPIIFGEKKYRQKITLTEEGKKTACSVNEKINIALADGGAGLSENERENFYVSLKKIAENLQAICDNAVI